MAGRHQGRKEPLRFQGSALDLVLLIRDLPAGPLPLNANQDTRVDADLCL